MKKLDKRLLRMIEHSKGQFISVTVIVAVALCIYIAFSMMSINIRDSVSYYYESTNFNDINVKLMKIPENALEKVKKIPGIKSVEGRISFDVPLRIKDNTDEKVTVRIISISDSDKMINKLYMKNGNSISSTNQVIVLDQFATARKIKPGDKITPAINGINQELSVSGIAASPEFVYLMENDQALLPAPEKFGILYVNKEFAQSAYGYRGNYNELLIQVYDDKNMDDLVDKIENELGKFGIKQIITREHQLSNNILTQKIDGIDKMSSAIPVLFLMVAALIISMMLSRTVSNDRIPIGVLKALGYGNTSILSHYTKYALAIGLAGSIIGISLGLLLAGVLTKIFIGYFNIPIVKVNIYYSYILNAMILTSVFCIFSGLFGAKSVIHILPADSMRPETPKSGKRILLERLTFIWRRISFSWKMVIRNIFRTKKRFALLVLGLALSYSINVVPLYMINAMSSMFTLQYGEYKKMDYNVIFSKPLSEKSMLEIKNLAQIDRIEANVEYPFELQNGWKKKAVGIVGIPKNTEFYEFRNKNDQKVILKENGLFITETLAKLLNVNKGDYLKIKNFIPGKPDISIKVVDIVKQYLGVNAYMDIDSMNKLLLEKGMVTGAAIRSNDNLKEKLKDIKNIAAVRSSADIKNSFLEYMDTMIIAVWFYMLFGGILAFAIIYNSTIIGISERNMEFASLRVMGFDKIDIYKMVVKENFVMAIIAIIVGIPIGIGMITGMADSFSSELITLPIIIEPKSFAFAALATIVFIAIAQFAAYKKIQNLNFIDALKSRIS